MLGALKWLGLLCKSRMARLVLLLTGRVVLLADVATAYLERGAEDILGALTYLMSLPLRSPQEMHFADALKPQELEDGLGKSSAE
eukprot:Skav215973  [mRNA]  locus=scaffold3174:65986:67106:+ [translate_table: standard]